MAEIFGVVASGLSVAQIAGEIIGTCLKIKRLMNDCEDMPAMLEELLNQVEVLAPIISETSAGNDTLPLQPPLNAALCNAVSHCQMALDQLRISAETLSNQIEASRGMKRKVRLVKALLKGDRLARCERSLQSAVQFLFLAQQTYIFALQRVQPEIIALQVFRHLEARSNHLSLEHGKDIPDSTPRNGVKPRRKTRNLDSIFSRSLRLGLPYITGVVEVYRPSSKLNIEEGSKENSKASLLQLKFHLPTWLCSMAFDSTMYRSYSGWTHCLKIYRIHIGPSSLMYTLWTRLKRDDADGLRRMFQDKIISPWDRIRDINTSREQSLLTLAIVYGAWKTGSYLLQHGTEQIILPGCANRVGSRAYETEKFSTFLEDDRLQDDTRIHVLAGYHEGSPEDFSRLRCRIWPDYEYYSNEFRNHRLDLAKCIAAIEGSGAMNFRLALSKSGHLNRNDVDFDYPKSNAPGILHVVAHAIAYAHWADSHAAQDWCIAASEVLKMVERYEILSSIRRMYYTHSHGSPLLQLFTTSFYATDSAFTIPRKFKTRARLNSCDKALRVWLQLVQQAGFDLNRYGIQEKQQLVSENRGGFQWYHVFRDPTFDRSDNGTMEIKLITITYGSEVDDWKLWWSEPTDELVGDFWRDIDPEPLHIPGSWVDDGD
ncbi:hypothetical protein ANO14919_107070 [Xylariales sp. No.14919]|nr:hypothetical protein ANO14919_107070 [Xylariales sp. No.14919]